MEQYERKKIKIIFQPLHAFAEYDCCMNFRNSLIAHITHLNIIAIHVNLLDVVM